MISKEEIEKDIKEINIIITTVREILQKDIKITDENIYTLDGRQYIAIEHISEYIEQQETNKQKIIERLEEIRNNLEKDGLVGYADEVQEILKIAKGV